MCADTYNLSDSTPNEAVSICGNYNVCHSR